MMRVFVGVTILSVLGAFAPGAFPQARAETQALIVCPKGASYLEELAAREIRRYVYVRTGELVPVAREMPGDRPAIIVARKDRPILGKLDTSMLGPQDYLLKTVPYGPTPNDRSVSRVFVAGGSDVGTLYGAYRFAEHLGVRFYLDGDVIPDTQTALELPDLNEHGSPLFALRGIQPFHDFPEGPDWWNPDDYKAIIGQLPKLRMNFFGLHTYPENRPNAEPTVWIGLPEDIHEDGRVAFAYPAIYYNTVLPVGWGLHARKTSGYSLGSGALFDRDGYGSEIMRGLEPRPDAQEDCTEVFNRAGAMLREAFTLARGLGVKTCVGTETPLVVPERVKHRIGPKPKTFAVEGGKLAHYANPIADTEDDALYQSVRWDLDAYRFAVPDGAYAVTLKFCEVAHERAGARAFDVAVEGKAVIDALDIFAKVGKNKALDYTFEDVVVSDGQLDVAFARKVEYPCIAAIVIEGPGVSRKVNCGGPAYEDYEGDDGAPVFDPAAIRKLYEGIFGRISRAYPIDYYWFWTPEGWTWSGVKEDEVRRTLDDILTAIAAAKAVNAPFQLATCGWVLGPQYDRALFDNALPKDVAVSCINRHVGHEPIEPGFADVVGRGKWAIPWLEDDPAMTSPQLWVGRMRRDAADALAYGCTGLLGIHWRTRILGPNVSALAQAAWDQSAWTAEVVQESGAVGGEIASFPDAEIAETDDDALYRTVRYGMAAYRLRVPNGPYTVTLKFCEPHYTVKGQRVFGVELEGNAVIEGLDVLASVGGNCALDYTFEDVRVDDGMLDIDFTRQVELPCIAAIAVEGEGFSEKINCGGPQYKDYGPDLEQAAPHRPTGDFYQDWALHQFGPEVGAEAAAIFEKVDGRLPRPSDWVGGPGGYKPDGRPWEKVKQDYAFVDELGALRGRVKGAGNLARFDYWLANFRFLRATGEMKCAWAESSRAMAQVKAEADAAKREHLAREAALPARKQLVAVVTEAYRELLATVHTSGAMGTVANLEQHTFPDLLEKPAKELADILGEALPDEAQLPGTYSGPVRLIVPTVRTCIAAGEGLNVKVIVLAEGQPDEVLFCWRPMGAGRFTEVPLTPMARATYFAALDAGDSDVEYYIQVVPGQGEAVRWPATAPDVNQTVVIAPSLGAG